MNILWLINIPLPEASILMNEQVTPFGGWLVNTSIILSQQNNVNLSIAFPKRKIKKITKLQGERITFYAFNSIVKKNEIRNKLDVNFEKIIKETSPNLVHIFGTEYLHTLAMVNICNLMNIKTVISIQGLVSICSKHYMACLPNRIQKRFTFRDFIKHDNLIQQQKKFVIRGKNEIEAIQKVNDVIGRTTWDKACTLQINYHLNYHFCNENLRGEFYKHEWLLDNCEKNSIFVSQGAYPLKGLHLMLEAMPLILQRFHGTKLYVSGADITKSNTLKDKIKMTSYAKYIRSLIQKLNLKDKVIFTGLLNEKQMCEQYLKSNVFVCPSSIENSPNSLGEAMILGVPCVASDVGGVSDMLIHKEEGFVYQSDATYMLAYYVCEIFNKDELAIKFSKNGKSHALITHDKEKNYKKLLSIYEECT
ncbi:MAG: glycosyltransferase family 4 protein [Spirochaetaceae bacterium]|nr:glycosyltransferase family 4 protein [Spirochaetaceae bacterium]